MARPSQGIDQALLRSGLALLPELGCTGLSVRRVAEHAGVNPAMFHYHFGSKAAFLRAVLQQLYEQMFAGLSAGAARDGTAVERLHAALFSLAGFVREQRPVIGRLAVDAANGEAVVHEFVRANAPRHLGLLLALGHEAEQAGELQPMAPLQRFAFLMGSIVSPILVVPAVAAVRAIPAALAATAVDQVLSDDALHQRITLALQALRPAPAKRSAERSTKAPAKRRPTPR